MINIVLVEPEIPQNTGNIARTCACTNSALHLVKPLGFDIGEKSIKRAGLDYWDKLKLVVYEDLDQFFTKNNLLKNSSDCKNVVTPQNNLNCLGFSDNVFCCSTKAINKYTDIKYPKNCFLLFGKETKGLPESLIFNNPKNAIKIPMGKNIRSLNLSNAVAIILYEALRQHDFCNLC